MPINKTTPEEQQVVLERIPYYHDLFHDTFFNNFSIVCLNRRYNKEILVENKIRSLRKLNVACYNLQVFTRMCLDKMHEMKEYSAFTDDLEQMDAWEEKWSRAVADGDSFVTYEFAYEVVSRIRQLNFPYDETLNSPRYSVIPMAFKNIDYKAKAFVKISIFAPRAEARLVLESFIALMRKNPLLFYYIERVEMTKQIFTRPGVGSLTDSSHPSLIIFFDSRIVSMNFHPVVNEVLEKLMPLLEPVTEIVFDDIYSRVIGKNTTLSQGYRNYKKFLDLVGSIEDVYDKKTGYSFINS